MIGIGVGVGGSIISGVGVGNGVGVGIGVGVGGDNATDCSGDVEINFAASPITFCNLNSSCSFACNANSTDPNREISSFKNFTSAM